MSSHLSDLIAERERIHAVGTAVTAVALIGALLFGAITILVAVAPGMIERAAHGYLSQRLQGELKALTGGAVDPSELISDPGLHQRYEAALNALGGKFPEAVDKLFAKLTACLCKHDCAARAKAQLLFDALAATLSDDARAFVSNLNAIARGRFDLILAKLRHELLLISAINAAIFGVLFFACLHLPKRKAVVVPAALMTASTVITAAAYFVGGDWWWTILTDGYWGIGYLTIDAVVAIFLMGVLFFDGRVTTGLIDSVADVLSSLRPGC